MNRHLVMPYMERFEYEERLATQRALERYTAHSGRIQTKKRLAEKKKKAERKSAIARRKMQSRR